MDALFVELPAFERYRSQYLDDADFRSLQQLLLLYPHVGDVIRGTGGLRKMRFANALRHAGKRGGIRIIYYWWSAGRQFWLFTLYAKTVQDDLTPHQCQVLKQLLDREYLMRTTNATQHLH
jgi:hypothetical protein